MNNKTKLSTLIVTGIFGAASIAAASPSLLAPRPESLPTPATLPVPIEARAEQPDVLSKTTKDRRKIVRVKKKGLPKIAPKSQLFMKLDANADGFVSYAEMQRGTPMNAKKHFARLDSNGDGKLSMDEMNARGKRDAKLKKSKKAKAKLAKKNVKLDREGRAKHDAKKMRRRS
ncbi:MAG: EF-hand domain-containing protein [Deltaproteobacteria bacterium]|jgi:hypothetical protein